MESWVRDMLNIKLNDMTYDFNLKLLALHKKNSQLNNQIRMYEETVEYGGIRIKDLNCLDMVWKLSVVEQDPV